MHGLYFLQKCATPNLSQNLFLNFYAHLPTGSRFIYKPIKVYPIFCVLRNGHLWNSLHSLLVLFHFWVLQRNWNLFYCRENRKGWFMSLGSDTPFFEWVRVRVLISSYWFHSNTVSARLRIWPCKIWVHKEICELYQ